MQQLYHLGQENTLTLTKWMLTRQDLKETFWQVVQGCEVCKQPLKWTYPGPRDQKAGHLPWGGLEAGPFPSISGRYLFRMARSFSKNKKEKKNTEMTRTLFSEIIPWSGLYKSPQSYNGFASKAEITQGLKTIEYSVSSTWFLEATSSGKVEKANDLLKRHPKVLIQETKPPWVKLLTLALLRLRNASGCQGLIVLPTSTWQAFPH